MEEALMIKNMKKGDMDSFTSFVRLYERRVYGFLLGMVHDRDDARDLTQEVLLKVFTSIYRFNEALPLRPWVFRIACNTAASHLKKKKVHIPLDESMEYGSSTMDDAEMRSLIRDEIMRFEPYARAVLILKIMEDFSFEQIALMLNSTASAIKMKYYRSRKVLAERLSFECKEE
jgi:RNA polymerase sigma-70 factor (ECF subfamily)